MTRRQLPFPRALTATVFVALVGAIGVSSASARAHGGTVPDCPSYTLVHPFMPWADPGSYFLAPGGSFEAPSGWSLSNGAARVSGNESSYVNSTSDSHSLALPRGGSATSPLVCVTMHEPDARLFVRNTGSATSTLKATLNYTDKLGQPQSKTVAVLAAGSAWTPSLPILFLHYVAPLVGGHGQTWVSFTFRSPSGGDGRYEGSGAAWQIDDFYIDPLKSQ